LSKGQDSVLLRSWISQSQRFDPLSNDYLEQRLAARPGGALDRAHLQNAVRLAGPGISFWVLVRVPDAPEISLS